MNSLRVTVQPGRCPGPRQGTFSSQYQIRFVSRADLTPLSLRDIPPLRERRGGN